MSVSPARVACSPDPKTRIRLDVGQADARRALDGARGFLETGVDAPVFIGPGQQMLPGTAFSYTLASLNGGDCQLPLEPRGLAKNRSSRRPLRRRESIHRHSTGGVNGADPRKGGCFEGGFWYLWL